MQLALQEDRYLKKLRAVSRPTLPVSAFIGSSEKMQFYLPAGKFNILFVRSPQRKPLYLIHLNLYTIDGMFYTQASLQVITEHRFGMLLHPEN